MEVKGSRCLRREQYKYAHDGERILTSQNAKDECSKNKRCVGIEPLGIIEPLNQRFKICLDSIYRSTAWDKYEKSNNQVLKKEESQSKFSNCRD